MSSFYEFANSVCEGTFSTEGTFDSQIDIAIPAQVRMFSGCMDEQTSADVKNTSKFGLRPALGPSGAGGACTNSILLTLQEKPEQSWSELLLNMRRILKKKRYSQIPQLSASQNMDLDTPFSLHNPQEKELGGRRKALLIGINYEGQPAKLNGCINDIRKIEGWVRKEGFEDVKLLSDEDDAPTVEGIVGGFAWLVDGAKAGDSLFMHYSGHGGRIEDDDVGEEKDGYDETIVPVDYMKSGQIRDDDIFSLLIAPLPKGVQLTVIMDCCHSGTILDLPYTITFDNDGEQSLTESTTGTFHMHQNPRFSVGRLMDLGKRLFSKMKNAPGVAPGFEMFKNATYGAIFSDESGHKQGANRDSPQASAMPVVVAVAVVVVAVGLFFMLR